MIQSSIIAKTLIVAPPPNTNPLLANKQVHEEALEIGWEPPRKCFNQQEPFLIVRLLSNISYNVMNCIHLDCRDEYFGITGVEIGPSPNIHRWLNTDPRTFPQFPNVKHLEILVVQEMHLELIRGGTNLQRGIPKAYHATKCLLSWFSVLQSTTSSTLHTSAF